AASTQPGGGTSSSAAVSGVSPSGGAASAPAAAAAGSAAILPPASTLRWRSCGGPPPGPPCAPLPGPPKSADPGGRKIPIALSMVPATAPRSQQQGVMLVNPGGPGEPGRALAGDVAAGISPQVAATYDIVGFDPRGVGGSSPSLSCDPNFFKGVRP